MTTMRNRLRRLELTLIHPSPLLVRLALLLLSAATLAILVGSAALEIAPSNRLRAGAYLLLALITRAIVQYLRAGVDYHPGHRNKEALIGWALAILAALTFAQDQLRQLEERFGVAILAWTPWLWIGILFVAQISMLDFTVRRNADPDRLVIKTSRGLVQVPDQRTRERLAEEVAAWLRHGLICSEQRELLKEGVGVPANDRWAEELREEARRRREAMARRDIIAAQIELRAEEDGD
jgi:hypothetical protein